MSLLLGIFSESKKRLGWRIKDNGELKTLFPVLLVVPVVSVVPVVPVV